MIKTDSLAPPVKQHFMLTKSSSTKDKEEHVSNLYDMFEDRFEKYASKAFLKLRQNADIFINLLILMVVANLGELNMKSIGFLKEALFLDVSEEEATVAFKGVIDKARKSVYRQVDNLFHVLNDTKKNRQQKKKESFAEKNE